MVRTLMEADGDAITANSRRPTESHAKMLHLPRGRHELEDLYHERRVRDYRETLQHYEFDTWDKLVHDKVFHWASYIMDFENSDPDRLSLHFLKWRNASWIKLRAVRDRGNQGHGKCVHVWRWEQGLYDCFGEDWAKVVTGKLDKADNLGSWREWCNNKYPLR